MSIPGERDESLEQWIRQLKPAERVATEGCLDAETAAAWVSGGLSGAPLQQAQSHLADCARCQALVGSLVKADVGGEVLKPISLLRRLFGWPEMLVPLGATALLAFGVWYVLPEREPEPETVVAEQTAAAEAQAAVVREEPPSAPALGRADQRPPAQPAAAAPTARALSTTVSSEQTVAKAEPPAPAAAAVAAPAVGSLARAQSQLSETVTTVAPTDIIAADPSIRWRITGRQVQRSMDGGSSWGSVQVGANAAFTAGSAPSRTTCWLVGRGGIVLVTIDSVTWTRVPFPEPVDLAGIAALDNRTAVVTTADGRTFRTADGGKTWTH